MGSKVVSPISGVISSVNRGEKRTLISVEIENDKKNTLFGFNKYNCNHYTITPLEGTVLLFPSRTLHQTQKFTRRNGERIVIAGDIRITLRKDNADYHQGCTHPSQWLEL